MTKPMVIAVGIGFCLGLGLSATGLPMTGQSALAADIYVQDPADLVPAERAADEKLAAQARIEQLNEALLSAMAAGDSLDYAARYDSLAPMVEETYNLPLMAQLSIGRSAWNALDDTQREALVDRFTAMSIAVYAARFNRLTDQQFSVNSVDEGPRETLIVNSKLVLPQGDDVNFAYVMRDSEAGWRIVDVFINGQYSELSRRRSEFSSVIRNDGLDALLARIDEIIAGYRSNAG